MGSGGAGSCISKLEFCVLYLSDDDVRRPASMEGSIPF
ncbi:MAG: DUF3794 domain-containing protein [Eisenbergiella sp.]